MSSPPQKRPLFVDLTSDDERPASARVKRICLVDDDPGQTIDLTTDDPPLPTAQAGRAQNPADWDGTSVSLDSSDPSVDTNEYCSACNAEERHLEECKDCGKAFCSKCVDHVPYLCTTCRALAPVCALCVQRSCDCEDCQCCDTTCCNGCVTWCDCGRRACNDCTTTCRVFSRTLCRDCLVCCTAQTESGQACKNACCNDCMIACETCMKRVCSECAAQCEECFAVYYCDTCAVSRTTIAVAESSSGEAEPIKVVKCDACASGGTTGDASTTQLEKPTPKRKRRGVTQHARGRGQCKTPGPAPE